MKYTVTFEVEEGDCEIYKSIDASDCESACKNCPLGDALYCMDLNMHKAKVINSTLEDGSPAKTNSMENITGNYVIHCTPSQTKKALELGAPLEIHDTFDSYDIKEANIFYKDKFIELADGRLVGRITAEQMIGWLEEQDSIREININRSACYEGWYYSISGPNKQYITIDGHSIASMGKYDSRSEATLAAIEVALKYLTENKK